MRRLIPVLFLLLAATGPGAAAAGGDRFAWPVLAVKDGDTLAVSLPGLPEGLNPVAIRVRGIDTPETGGRAKCASERNLGGRATDFTREAIRRGSVIEFAEPSWDKYGGRIDADVWIDGELLAQRLIAAGLARSYDGGKRGGWC